MILEVMERFFSSTSPDPRSRSARFNRCAFQHTVCCTVFLCNACIYRLLSRQGLTGRRRRRCLRRLHVTESYRPQVWKPGVSGCPCFGPISISFQDLARLLNCQDSLSFRLGLASLSRGNHDSKDIITRSLTCQYYRIEYFLECF